LWEHESKIEQRQVLPDNFFLYIWQSTSSISTAMVGFDYCQNFGLIIYLFKFSVVESENANEVDGERKKDSGEGVLPLPNGNGKYGEMGKPVVLPSNMSAGMKKLVDEGWQKNAFNQYVSDLISVRRTLPDPRDDWCVFVTVCRILFC